MSNIAVSITISMLPIGIGFISKYKRINDIKRYCQILFSYIFFLLIMLMYYSWVIRSIRNSVVCMIGIIITLCMFYNSMKPLKIKYNDSVINDRTYLTLVNNQFNNRPYNIVKYSLISLLIVIIFVCLISVLMAAIIGPKSFSMFEAIMTDVAFSVLKLFCTSIFLSLVIVFLQKNNISKSMIIIFVGTAFFAYALTSYVADMCNLNFINTNANNSSLKTNEVKKNDNTNHNRIKRQTKKIKCN